MLAQPRLTANRILAFVEVAARTSRNTHR
jgi:hypothetical protein